MSETKNMSETEKVVVDENLTATKKESTKKESTKKLTKAERWVDLIDLTVSKAAIKEQIGKRKEKIDFFITEKKKFEDAVKKANR